jgi:hypothetical protein
MRWPACSFTCGVIDFGMGFGHVAVNDRARTAWCQHKSEDRIMPHTQEAARRKRRIKPMPVLGAAGLSLTLAGATSPATGSINPDPTRLPPVAWQVMDEEEISEVSLATFHVLDNGSAGIQRTRIRPAMVAQGACGADLYYPQSPPAVSAPAYQVPPPPRSRPIRPAYKYKRS